MESEDTGNAMRLSKLLAERGVASRRAAAKRIEDGEVRVNGQVVRAPGTKVDPDRDVVTIGKEPLPEKPKPMFVVLYKPKGYITGRDDPQGRRSVLSLVENYPVRLEPFGRLDYDTEGVLLLTNDGMLAHKLTHPSTGAPKRYRVKVYRTPTDRAIRRLEKGINLEDGRTAPAKVRRLEQTDRGNCWLEVTVTEGRNRLVRRMMAAVGHPVSKLRRVSFATVSLQGLERGQARQLTGDELARVRDIASGVPAQRAGHQRSRKGFAKAKTKVQPNLGRGTKSGAKRRRQRERSRATTSEPERNRRDH